MVAGSVRTIRSKRRTAIFYFLSDRGADAVMQSDFYAREWEREDVQAEQAGRRIAAP